MPDKQIKRKEIIMVKEKVICDICGKKIKESYDLRWMITLSVGYPYAYNDGGSRAAVERVDQDFHLHFNCSKPLFKSFPELVPKGL